MKVLGLRELMRIFQNKHNGLRIQGCENMEPVVAGFGQGGTFAHMGFLNELLLGDLPHTGQMGTVTAGRQRRHCFRRSEKKIRSKDIWKILIEFLF